MPLRLITRFDTGAPGWWWRRCSLRDRAAGDLPAGAPGHVGVVVAPCLSAIWCCMPVIWCRT
ncbi:MAG: hypothetical protein ACRDSE_11640, partial [Pseudonocardiaceae bacterium]